MDKVLSKSNKTQQTKQAKLFIRVFGTHFISQSQFGASMVYEKQYNSRSTTQEQKNTREQFFQKEEVPNNEKKHIFRKAISQF